MLLKCLTSDLPVIEAANILVEEHGTHQEVETAV